MNKTLKYLSKVRNDVNSELKKLPKSESSESRRYILNLLLERTETMICLIELIE